MRARKRKKRGQEVKYEISLVTKLFFDHRLVTDYRRTYSRLPIVTGHSPDCQLLSDLRLDADLH
ncbi:hypothetical protein MA16_Dca025555 [Dendrobium catenatum]|uniref:Uncharacterized protein n=1 Tax=Dendrobium catenatum TaxID=906689 RepID=A0A2I0WRG6_9ASPA|nr:hypothetical protein MA16_Dca025555 [Dendrobium catenatum]